MKLNRTIIKDVAKRCGLAPASVRDLLNAGWTFHLNYKGEITWTKE